MKFKEQPEDFIVKEVLPNSFIKDKGQFKVFALVKKGVDTLTCLQVIAKKFSIGFNDIGYCGLKDKHGLTTQYITVPKGDEFRTGEFKLKFCGYSDKHLQRGDNKGNEFIINIKVTPEETELIRKNESRVKEGFTNYYDTQRTGHELLGKTFAEFILKKDYKTALLRYYINKSKFAGKKLKQKYKEAFKNWNNPGKCYELLKGFEKNLTLRPLKEAVSGDYLNAIKRIPGSELELLIAGYQALLWNNNPVPELSVIKIPELGIERKGKREITVRPENLKICYAPGEALLEFFLPKGAFATILLKELVRK